VRVGGGGDVASDSCCRDDLMGHGLEALKRGLDRCLPMSPA